MLQQPLLNLPMDYAKIRPEDTRSGLIHSDYAQDIELLAYDMARLGVVWPSFKRIFLGLIISNFKKKNINRQEMAKRLGLKFQQVYDMEKRGTFG